jgi:hypothetical protein
MEHPVPFTESGCTPPGEKIPTRHHPEGIDPDQMFFQEARVHELILSYQRDGDPETWQAIVMACLPLIDSLIRKHHFQIYEDVEALRTSALSSFSRRSALSPGAWTGAFLFNGGQYPVSFFLCANRSDPSQADDTGA